MTTFLAIRLFGPLTAAELSRRVSADRYTVIVQAEALVERGLTEQSPSGLWDITERGKASIDPTLRNWGRAKAQATRRWPFERGRTA